LVSVKGKVDAIQSDLLQQLHIAICHQANI
jgi:hypothetical protein